MPVCWMVSRTVNYPFLQGLGLRTIVSLLPSAPVPDLCDFCKAHGIAHVPALWNASVARTLCTWLDWAVTQCPAQWS
jgi:hypothetical protein|eukprot:SAG25_NODE_1006_length_4335_cov_4.453494_6_plen_77_part_00